MTTKPTMAREIDHLTGELLAIVDELLLKKVSPNYIMMKLHEKFTYLESLRDKPGASDSQRA